MEPKSPIALEQLQALMAKPIFILEVFPDGRFNMKAAPGVPLAPLEALKLLVGVVEDVRFQVHEQQRKSPLAL